MRRGDSTRRKPRGPPVLHVGPAIGIHRGEKGGVRALQERGLLRAKAITRRQFVRQSGVRRAGAVRLLRHTANVVVQPSGLGTEPLQVVQYAKELFENGDPHTQIQPRAFEQVYAVFDRDDHRTYSDALRSAESRDGKLHNDNKQPGRFRVIASVPSFELWLLLHYEDIQAPIHRDEVMQRLKRHMPGYAKGTGGAFAITRDRLEAAMQRLKLWPAGFRPTTTVSPTPPSASWWHYSPVFSV
jgi:hypothetical protein